MKTKTIIFLLAFVCMGYAQSPFVTTWGGIFGSTVISFNAVTGNVP